MKRIVFFGIIVCSLVMMSSCAKRLYWEDMQPNYRYPITRKPEIKIQPGDKLRIVVSAKDPTLATPYNLGVIGYQVDVGGAVRTNTTDIESGYLVDNDGYIDLPVLGRMHVEGLTLQELSNQLKTTLRRGPVKDAIVTVNLLNLKIIVLGEVASEGIISTMDDRITLLDAIIRAGGLRGNASMKEVIVIREEANQRRMLVHDISKVKIFNEPSFYLQQNDIVYVKPKAASMTPIGERGWQLFYMLLTASSMFVSLMVLLKNNNQ